MNYELSTRYALLTRLPLLQGISSRELLGWEETLRLDIDELPASDMPIIRQGDTCSQLIYLVEGVLQKEHRSADGTYTARSHLKAPAVIEVDRLFGLTPTYEYTWRAKTDVKMLGIRKALIGSHLMKSEVFRLNMLNMLSAYAQKRATALLPCRLDSAEARLRHFLGRLFPDSEATLDGRREGQGEVELFIKMTELARYIGERRITVSGILNRWDKEGSIRLGRGHFTVTNLQALLKNNKE